jgi:hypothetical protein
MKILNTLALAAIVLSFSGMAHAAVIVDDEGKGFVGKGDVQLVFGWSNKQLQDNAEGTQFRLAVETGGTVWKCLNSHNGNVQERSTETSSLQLVASTARVRNQVTGFNLNGVVGDAVVTVTGNAVGTCPSGSNWDLIAGSVQAASGTSSGAALQVSADIGVTWSGLALDPVE